FRLPELLGGVGVELVEVGTTNRSTLADYRAAIGARTGLVLKIHPSNFTVSGFTAAVSVRELAGLAVPVLYDIGSGLLGPDPALPAEPDATTALREGASVVTASGDKLLGGPQAGIVLGRAELVERMRRHPLARALRVDKLTLAALEATLRGPASPVSAAVHAEPSVLQRRALALATALNAKAIAAEVVPHDGAVGGGGAPGIALPGYAVAVAEALAVPLRTGDPPVIGRLCGGRLLLDLRAVSPDDDAELAEAVIRSGS
ncbi:MAG: aminotransferase class V-fold PLP-dependent enzyme, partial [Mycobacteriales bacterium]